MGEVKVKVTIDPKDNSVQYEVEGMPGTGCTDITSLLTQNLDVQEEGQTEEFLHQQEMPAYVEDL